MGIYSIWLGSDENAEERNNQKTAQKCAENLIVKALQRDRIITPILKEAVAQGTGHLEGLNHRIKGRDSLVRKLISKSKQKSLSVEEYSEKVTDVLRYTNVSDVYKRQRPYRSFLTSPMKSSRLFIPYRKRRRPIL